MGNLELYISLVIAGTVFAQIGYDEMVNYYQNKKKIKEMTKVESDSNKVICLNNYR